MKNLRNCVTGGYNGELVWGDRQSVGGFDFASSRYSKRLVWSSHQLDGRVGEFLMSVFSLKY